MQLTTHSACTHFRHKDFTLKYKPGLRCPVVTGLLMDHRNWPLRCREVNSVSRTSGVLSALSGTKGGWSRKLIPVSTLHCEQIRQRHLRQIDKGAFPPSSLVQCSTPGFAFPSSKVGKVPQWQILTVLLSAEEQGKPFQTKREEQDASQSTE